MPQVETIKRQIVARHRCVYNFVRAVCAKEARRFYDGSAPPGHSHARSSGATTAAARRINIDLSDCLIDDETVSLIVKAIRESSCNEIHELVLRRNIITDRGARRLAMHLQKKMGRIHLLDLRENKISATGA